MPTRIITASIASNSAADLDDGKFAGFEVTSDTGAASGIISGARLSVSSVKCYGTTAYLDLMYHTTTQAAIASTNALSGNDTTHAEDFTLAVLSDSLLTATPSMVYLQVMATSGTGSKINFRTGCTITLEIDYTLPPTACTPPSNVKLSARTSTGGNVTLSWSAGAGGTNNAASYYQIARRESTDGRTWDSRKTYKSNVGNVTAYSVPPPAAYGHYFRYFVRLVGAAGTDYASEWVACENDLQLLRPALVAYTDPTITAGTTKIKAAHILELRTNIDRLRQGLGMAAYSYTSLVAGRTSLARWRAHILELRAAIDEISPEHEAWIAISVNRPTAAVMQQLRRVVAAI